MINTRKSRTRTRLELEASPSRRRWLLRVTVMLGGTVWCAGCAETTTATDGRAFRQASAGDSISSALMASASHDLPCSDSLDIRRLDPQRAYEVTGCGWRAVYRVVTPSVMNRRVELVNRSPSRIGVERLTVGQPAASL